MSHGDRQGRTEQLVATLRRQVLAESLAAGERLPGERQLAEQLGTNRNTLREALRGLEGLGLVSVRHGRGVTVEDFRQSGGLRLVPYFLLEGRNPMERLRVFSDLLYLRRVLLAEAGPRAAARGGPAAASELWGLLGGVQRALQRGTPADAMRADLALYRAIADATGSLALRWAFNTFHNLFEADLQRLEDLWSTSEGYLEGLRVVVERITAGDSGGARSALLSHLEQNDASVTARVTRRAVTGALGRPVGAPAALDPVPPSPDELANGARPEPGSEV